MFSASLDTMSKWISGLGTISFFFPIISLFALDAPWHVLIGVSALFIVIQLLLYLYSPKAYEVTQDYVMVHRRAGDFYIKRSDIKQMHKIDRTDLGRTWRMWGNYGLWGYTGWYSTQKYGTTRWFVTNKDKLVFIRLENGKKYLLSPDNPEGFIQASTNQYVL